MARPLPYPNVIRAISVIGFILSIGLCMYGWKQGLFTSQQKLQDFVSGFGYIGALVFVLFQVVQVVVPILPGGISCLAGVLMFGAWNGFLYNYIGICIGSILAFLLAKTCGRPLLQFLFHENIMRKYEEWTTSNHRFTKMFAIAIVLPVAPDDFLCYMAGTTEMTLPIFTIIIVLGKPFAIAAYSFGLHVMASKLACLAV